MFEIGIIVDLNIDLNLAQAGFKFSIANQGTTKETFIKTRTLSHIQS
jgi:hypothetical protein